MDWEYPAARAEDVVDEIHGVKVPDPYLNMAEAINLAGDAL